MHSILTGARHLAQEIIFPRNCLGCMEFTKSEADFSYLCKRCFLTISINTSVSCPVCHRRVIWRSRSVLATHPTCQKKRPYVLSAATQYKNPLVQRLIYTYKYERVKNLSEPLAEILAQHCKRALRGDISSYVIVPIPLHRKKELRRGFNQSALLGKILCENLQLKLETNALIRSRGGSAQAKISDWNSREKNIAGCFSVPIASAVNKKNILLLDDVTTSGATLTEAAKTLRTYGAKKIIGLVVARG